MGLRPVDNVNLAALKAEDIWVQEYADDTAILSFFEQTGFEEGNRFTPAGYREMVVLVRPFE